ncbi:unnamed protein product [Citrullus colocynthis]|uniref:NmrA-like domain-containing protein n=1 Tax=Citrullus colocynthis TaxID=252529 RepID=A0ABP0YB23_9ROSI
MAAKSRILIVGGTGYIGKFIVEANAKAGHETYALVRDSALSDRAKSLIVHSFKSIGVILVYGDLFNHESLVRAIKQVDVVISRPLVLKQLADQDKLIFAIKEAGLRFFPSEFGFDVENVHGVGPLISIFETKAQLQAITPPTDKVVIKQFSIRKKILPPTILELWMIQRTLNKVLHIKPPQNVLSINELVALWENKIGKTLEKTYISEDQLPKNIQEAVPPLNLLLSLDYSILVKGDHTNQEIEAPVGLKASKLYSDVKYTSIIIHFGETSTLLSSLPLLFNLFPQSRF